MIIIVGLGNPTKEYENTRHNIGFMAIDELADKYNIGISTIQHKATVGKGIIAGKKVILAKPLTFMNLSGESVRELADYYKADYESEIIVISDDINLPVEYIRVRPEGSAGGHNGLKNIISNLGTQKFIRIRVGVGEKPKRMDLVDYVLGKFPSEEREGISRSLNDVCEAIEMILEGNIEKAMNSFNRKVTVEK